MAWRTGLPTCSAQSAFWLCKLTLALFLCLSPVAAQGTGGSNVHDCRPCSFSPGGDFPPYSFTFVLKTTADRRTVSAIEVTRDSKSLQRLPVTGMESIGAEEDFFFGGQDINFDGLLDLLLIVRRGAANAYAVYWLFDPKSGVFTALGTYPIFRVDPAKHLLYTYEGGGDGGLIHEAKEYTFLEGKLTLTRDEKQDATKQPGLYRKVISERTDGVMKIVKTEMVQAPK
jgi:hypothetical protein